jgi:hypothetical protein
MKVLTLISAAMMLMTVSCGSSKYDKKREEIQKQEAIDMIKKSDDIEIDKGWGNDKIILKDQ